MKHQLKKYIKKYWGTMCLLAAVLLLVVTGSFAAYTNFSSVKRVVSVKSRNQVLFSSNLLYSEEKDEISSGYKYKKITLNTDLDTQEKYFTVEIYNYNIGDTSTYNNKTITYKLNATVYTDIENAAGYMVNGTSFQESNGSYFVELPGQQLLNDSFHSNSYKFIVPQIDADQVKICVEAIPDVDSYSATDNRKLAAYVTTGEVEMEKNWAGHFLDETEGRYPYQYDGFNYEISGNGYGKVILTWETDKLQISPWFPKEVGVNNPDLSSGTIEFGVGGANQPSAYQTQFYPVNKESLAEWRILTDAVAVKFEKSKETEAETEITTS